jgi:hypothetical protein
MTRRLALLTPLLALALLPPSTATTLDDSCGAVDTSDVGCFSFPRPPPSVVTSASVTFDCTRTSTGCTVTVSAQVHGANPLLTYGYRMGVQEPFLHEKAAHGVDGPVHAAYGPRTFAVARGTPVQAWATIAADTVPTDQATELRGFTC